jgi:hypothetical protein
MKMAFNFYLRELKQESPNATCFVRCPLTSCQGRQTNANSTFVRCEIGHNQMVLADSISEGSLTEADSDGPSLNLFEGAIL